MSDLLPPELLKSLQDDEEVKGKVKELVLFAVEEAYELLANGAPVVKQTLLRTLLPAAVRVSQQANQDEQLNYMREQMAALIGEIRGNSTQEHQLPDTSGAHPHLKAVETET